MTSSPPVFSLAPLDLGYYYTYVERLLAKGMRAFASQDQG